MRDLQFYMSLPYTITLRPDEDGDVVARVTELPGCVTHGSSIDEALTAIREVQREWIAQAIKTGVAIPEPSAEDDEAELPSGKWLQRVPRALHSAATKAAEDDGVSLNAWVTAVIAQAVGRANQKSETEFSIINAVRELIATQLEIEPRHTQRPHAHGWMQSGSWEPESDFVFWAGTPDTGAFLEKLTGGPANQVCEQRKNYGAPGLPRLLNAGAAHRGWPTFEYNER